MSLVKKITQVTNYIPQVYMYNTTAANGVRCFYFCASYELMMKVKGEIRNRSNQYLVDEQMLTLKREHNKLKYFICICYYDNIKTMSVSVKRRATVQAEFENASASDRYELREASFQNFREYIKGEFKK